jgi:hypothetical protein
VIVTVGFVAATGYADVGDMIPPSQLTASASGQNGINSPQDAVNGAGLTGDVHEYNGGSWISSGGGFSGGWLSVDLGGTYNIGDVVIWNLNEGWDWDMYGIRLLDVYVSNMAAPGNPIDNPGNWLLVIDDAELVRARGNGPFLNQDDPIIPYDWPDTVNLEGAKAAHVAFVCVDNFAGFNYAGLSEVQFYEGAPPVVGRAWDPAPYPGEPDVKVDRELEWTIGEDPNKPGLPYPPINKHSVWMSDGVSEELSLVDTIDVSEALRYTYTPASDLARDAVYYWRVDEGIEDYAAGDPNNIIGDLWSFETVPSTPIIDADYPADTLVFELERAVLQVVVTNPFGDANDLSYEWYKYVDGVNDTPVTDADEEDDTYTIESVTDLDQGLYYCRVKIGSNSATDDSRMAALSTKRLIGHWPLGDDHDYDDIAGGNHGEPSGTMVFVEGITEAGQALEFNGIDTSISIPPAALSEIHDRVTISLWLFGGQSQPSEDTVFEAYDDAGLRVLGTHTPWGARVYFDAGNPDGEPDRIDKAAQEYEYKGQWNHWVYCKDAATGDMKLYLNGLLWHSGTDKIEPMYGATNFVIGRGFTEDQQYDGLIDDIRLYNYALDPTEVAVLYSDVQGSYCVDKPELDYSDNCIVDLADFAVFAQSWMECGMFPECVDTIE